MSLFDVIRYPISDPPTEKELSALPEDLYYKWFKTMNWSHHTTPSIVAEWFAVLDYPTRFRTRALETLQRLIREYDEPF